MGMTIKSALDYLKDFDSYTPYQEAINKVSDWIELFQVNYDKRLKADMVAMLTEIQLEIEEHEESIIGHYGKETKESDFPSHKIERNNGRKECANLIQQKIDRLKGERNED